MRFKMSAGPGDSSDEVRPGGNSSPERAKGTRRRPAQSQGGRLTLTAIAALLAATASTVGVAYQVWPKHRFHASLTVVPLPIQSMSYHDYLGGLRGHAERNGCGVVISLRADITGVDRSGLKLSSAVYGASNKAILRWRQPLREVFRHGAAINEQIGRAWIPSPDVSGKYYVHFELYADKAFIAYANSRTFPVKSLPSYINPCST